MSVHYEIPEIKEFKTEISEFNDLVNVGFKLHNHICPAMPLGIRAGLLALRNLGVNRSQNKELFMVVENGPSHAALCFSDGLQVATSCTFGKGNIKRTNDGKNAFTLINTQTKKGVRITIRYSFFEGMLNSEFVKQRKSGKEPYNIDESIAVTGIQAMLQKPEDVINECSEHLDLVWEKKTGTFEYGQCMVCKEPVFESGLRQKEKKILSQKCSGY